MEKKIRCALSYDVVNESNQIVTSKVFWGEECIWRHTHKDEFWIEGELRENRKNKERKEACSLFISAQIVPKGFKEKLDLNVNYEYEGDEKPYIENARLCIPTDSNMRIWGSYSLTKKRRFFNNMEKTYIIEKEKKYRIDEKNYATNITLNVFD